MQDFLKPLDLYFQYIDSFQVLRLIVFAFSEKVFAENSKLSADSGFYEIQLLECMAQWDRR